VNYDIWVSKTLYHCSLSLTSNCFCETQYLHFTTRVFGHRAISPFLGGYIYIYIYTRAYIYICRYICTVIYIYVYFNIFLHIKCLGGLVFRKRERKLDENKSTSIFRSRSRCCSCCCSVYVYMYMYAYVCVRAWVCMYIYVHIYTHAYHICKNTLTCLTLSTPSSTRLRKSFSTIVSRLSK